MRWSRTFCLLACVAGLVIACGAPKQPQAEAPVQPTIVSLRDAGTDAGGPTARDVSLVTKFPRRPDSCWKGHECGGGRVCEGPDPDATVGGCPVPGCRERAFARSCGSNRDCYTGYGCVLGHSDWAGPGESWHCEKIHCAADADCFSRNLRCERGECVGIPCTTDSQCDGYCMGTCSAKPGICIVPQPLEPRP